MRIALLAPIAWRTPPRHYGPWERVVSLLAEELVAKGIDVTLFATGNSETSAKLDWVCKEGYEENVMQNAKVWECLHISNVFENAQKFSLIHNHFDFLPLSYSNLVSTPLLTTIHGFSSPSILPVYKKYNHTSHYVSISDSDRSSDLDYIATVHHGIDLENFTMVAEPEDYLIFFGRIHPDKGAAQAIEISQQTNKKLIMAGIIQDETYFKQYIKPHIDADNIKYVGSVGPKERDKLLGRACAMLHPIQFDEPFGLSVIEAMACGTPVVAFDRGSMPELISNGYNGFLVKNVDEASRAINSIQLVNRSNCRQTVQEKFTSKRMAKDYITVYEKIIETASLAKKGI